MERGADRHVGTGIDYVHVYAIAKSGAGPMTFPGAVTCGGARTDVAAVYGAQFTNSAHTIVANGLAPGYCSRRCLLATSWHGHPYRCLRPHGTSVRSGRDVMMRAMQRVG